jgi:peptidoglycan/LPS O-acetylase OafA/YrhL
MVQAVPGFRGVNVPSWSVSCEVAAYLVFPVLALWALKLSARAAASWATVILVIGAAALTIAAQAGMSTHWPRICVEFTAGVLLWVWWRDRRRESAGWDVAAIGSVVAVAVTSYFMDVWSPESSFVVLPLLALFVVACASATGPFARLLCSGPMRWGGKISYSLYLTHNLVFVVLRHLVPWQDYVDADLWLRLGLVAVMVSWILGAAAGLYYGVEEPVRKLLLRWWARRYPPVPLSSGAVIDSESEALVRAALSEVRPQLD